MQKDRHKRRTEGQKKLCTWLNDLLEHLPSQGLLVVLQDNTLAEEPAVAVVAGSTVAVPVALAESVEAVLAEAESVDREVAVPVVLVEAVGLARVVVLVWGWAHPYFVLS